MPLSPSLRRVIPLACVLAVAVLLPQIAFAQGPAPWERFTLNFTDFFVFLVAPSFAFILVIYALIQLGTGHHDSSRAIVFAFLAAAALMSPATFMTWFK